MKTAHKVHRWPPIGFGYLMVGLIAIVVAPVNIAWAHNLNPYSRLPAPLWLYAFAVMATVIASVAMVDTFVRDTSAQHGRIVSQTRMVLRPHPMANLLIPPIVMGWGSVGVFVILLMVSYVSDPNPTAEAFNTASSNQVRSVRITMPPGITFERCVSLTPDHTLFYRFQADQPLVVDIHYHAQNVRHYAIPEHLAKREQRTYTPFSAQEYCLTWQNPASEPVAFSWALTAIRADIRVGLIP